LLADEFQKLHRLAGAFGSLIEPFSSSLYRDVFGRLISAVWNTFVSELHELFIPSVLSRIAVTSKGLGSFFKISSSNSPSSFQFSSPSHAQAALAFMNSVSQYLFDSCHVGSASSASLDLASSAALKRIQTQEWLRLGFVLAILTRANSLEVVSLQKSALGTCSTHLCRLSV
jgi:hypothetical protein